MYTEYKLSCVVLQSVKQCYQELVTHRYWGLSANKEKKGRIEAIIPLFPSLFKSPRNLSCTLWWLTSCFHHAIVLFKISPRCSDMPLINKQFLSNADMPGTTDINMTQTWPCHWGIHVLVGRPPYRQIIAKQSQKCNGGSAYKVLWEQTWGAPKFSLVFWRKRCQGLDFK